MNDKRIDPKENLAVTETPKAIALEGGYEGQGWYVVILGEPLDSRGEGCTKAVAERAAQLINEGTVDSASEAIYLAKGQSK